MLRTYLIIVSLLCAIAGECINPSTLLVPCRDNDEYCMVQSANSVIPLITSGIEALNTEVLDPLHLGVVEDNDPKFTFKFRNNTVTGFSTCEITTVKLNLDAAKLNFTLKCPTLLLNGKYDITGEVLNIPINVTGCYKVTTGKILYEFAGDIEQLKGSDEEMHLVITNYNTVGNVESKEKLFFDSFSPKDIPASVMDDFNNARDDEVIRVVKPVYIKRMFDVIVRNVNNLLAAVPLDNLFIQ